MDFKSLVGRFTKQGNGSELFNRLTTNQSLAVATVEPWLAEAARAGRRFGGGNQIIANGIAPVTAIPTTTATLALYNGEADGGRSYFVDHIMFWLGSGTPTAGGILMVGLSQAKIAAAVAMATGYGKASLSAGGLSSLATFGTAVTLTGTPSWVGMQGSMQLAAANVGQSAQSNPSMWGGICIKPGFALGFAILSGTGTSPLYGISCTWTELDADTE